MAALLFCLSACEDILDITPQDRVDLSEFYETPSDAESGLIGVYYPLLRNMIPNLVFNNNLSAGELYDAQRGLANRPVGYRPALRIDNDGGTAGDWRTAYTTIARANLLLERIDDIPETLFESGTEASNSRKEEIIGETRFLRAYTYFQLFMLWGEVPLVTDFPTTSEPLANTLPRSSGQDIMNLINEDLLYAEANLPWNHENLREFGDDEPQAATLNSKGRATKGAAKMLLAKIHLMNQEWQQAADKAGEVINNGEFVLADRWTDIFYNVNGQNSSESIWETETFREEFNNTGGYFFRVETPSRTSATPRAYRLFGSEINDSTDVRRGFSMSPSTTDPANVIASIKYYNRGGGYSAEDPFNFVLFRLSEAFLIRAEALNELQYGNPESLEYINLLRARAAQEFDGTVYSGIPPVDYAQYPDQASFRQLIRDERWRELMFEGHQWYDLLRYDSYDGGQRALRSVYLDDPSIPGADPGKILFPIPDREMRVNDALVQNAGYE